MLDCGSNPDSGMEACWLTLGQANRIVLGIKMEENHMPRSEFLGERVGEKDK